MEDSPEIVLGRRVWYALLRAIDQLIKVLIQSFDICFFSFLSINVHFFFFAKTTAVTIQSVVAISSRSVSRMRVYRGGREGRGVTGELFILKTTFSPPAFWGGTDEKFFHTFRA